MSLVAAVRSPGRRLRTIAEVPGGVGLRELRQDASRLIRRVETGEQIDITVAGRLAARIVPVAPKRWQTWDACTSVSW